MCAAVGFTSKTRSGRSPEFRRRGLGEARWLTFDSLKERNIKRQDYKRPHLVRGFLMGGNPVSWTERAVKGDSKESVNSGGTKRELFF